MGCLNANTENVFYGLSDYQDTLISHNLMFAEGDFFLRIGTTDLKQGWMLSISVIPCQMGVLLGAILPTISRYNVPFKIVKSYDLQKRFNSGQLGRGLIGRNIVFFLEDLSTIGEFLQWIILVGNDFLGPEIKSDFRIGRSVYVRYGSFDPHLVEDSSGNLHRVIMDGHGRWFRDKYRIPPRLPEGVENPFLPFINSLTFGGFIDPLLNKYKMGDLLENDLDTTIYRGLVISGSLMGADCLIVKGKDGILIDDFNRGVSERFKWMLDVVKELREDFKLPDVIDHWQEGCYSFIVFLGREMSDFKSISEGMLTKKDWKALAAVEKRRMIRYWLDLASEIGRLHLRGYVHRNLNWRSVKVSSSGDIILMGWDLAYNLSEKGLREPFEGGLKGFISPSQMVNGMPVLEDDIYSFGAIVISMFSSLSPHLLIEGNSEAMVEKIFFFTGNDRLANLISACISFDEARRPGINSIVQELSLIADLCDRGHSVIKSGLSDDEIWTIIKRGVKGLSHASMLDDGLWFSHVKNEYDREVYPLGDKYVFTSLHRGVGGVLYFLCDALTIGLELGHLEAPLERAFRFIESNVWNGADRIPAGLHYGASGMAVLIEKALGCGLLGNKSSYSSLMTTYFGKENLGLNIIDGLAGDGLALIQCRDVLGGGTFEDLINPLANRLVRSQDGDGAWRVKDKKGNSETVNGFGYGIAGIIFFLLEYSRHSNKNTVELALESGFQYMDSIKILTDGVCRWPNGSRDFRNGSWWCHGSAGIALTYLRSFEYFGNRQHLEAAEMTLRRFPTNFVSKNLSQCHGIVGLGEVYLEAFRVTGCQEWWDRASAIVRTVCAMRFRVDQNTTYWLVDNEEFPTADFMIGNSGVLHFLIRYLNMDKLFFPLLPVPLKK